MKLSTYQNELNSKNPYDLSGLTALYINCTLKRSPATSNTEGLIAMSEAIMKANGVTTEVIRAVDHAIAFGSEKDMREHGWKEDDWPALENKVLDADILILGTPVWLGDKSAVASLVIERLDAYSGELNREGQSIYYNKVAGCLITGNEDGAKHCAMNILYSLQHIGYVIPPQADAYWVGEAGPGPSYLDKDSGGPESDFTNRNTTFMTWNLMHMAAMIKRSEGIPPYGNRQDEWKKKEKDHPDPRPAVSAAMK